MMMENKIEEYAIESKLKRINVFRFQSKVNVRLVQTNRSTSQQCLTPKPQQRASTPAQPGYMPMGHHTTSNKTVKPAEKKSHHNMVAKNTDRMQTARPHLYAVRQKHTQPTSPLLTYKQPQAASLQSKFSAKLSNNQSY